MSSAPVSTKPANLLMALTYAVAAGGLGIGFSTLSDDPPSLTWAALLAVGGGGVLSFVRHAVFHRADAQRIGWTSERTNAFQIEVGLANLAWGAFAILAVVLGWGLVAEAAAFLVFGLYMGLVGIFEIVSLRGENARPLAQVLPSIAFAGLLLYVGFAGMAAA
jgi:hypothetical protein